MSRKVILGLVLILIIIGVLLLISQLLPEKKITNCEHGDGFCPEGCIYDLDHDCPETGVTSYGEVRHCLSETDCIVVRPLCGNLNCIHTHNECQRDCYCVTAINKIYETVWSKAFPECIGEIPCGACPEDVNYEVTCDNGECRTQQVR